MKFIENKKSQFVVLTNRENDVFTDYAVKTFIDVIEKSTGVKLCVSYDAENNFISIGNTTALKKINPKTSYGKDGLAVKEIGGNLYLFGQSEYGAIWAVYEFLERYVGYKFYAIDEIKIPKKDQIDFTGADIEYTPSFPHRCSGFGLAQKNKDYATGLKAYAYYGQRLDGKDFWGAWAHNFVGVFIKPEKYYDKHPEWFYHMDGETDVSKMKPIRMQLCLSNMEMRDEFSKNLIEWIKENEHATYFLLGREDNDGFCECENCKKITEKIGESGLHMDFINDMARRVEKWRKENAPEREILIGGLAYECGYGKVDTCFVPPVKKQGDKYVPVHPSVVAEPNVFMFFCPITAPEHSKSIYCEANKNLLDIMNRWKVVCKRFGTQLYYGTFRRGFEFVDGIYRIKEDINFYKDSGFEIFYMESPNVKALNAMTLYLVTSLEWNSSLDTDEIIKEFCDNYYKQASPFVLKYFYYMMEYCQKTRQRIEYLTGQRYDYGMCLTDTVPQGFWELNAVYDACLLLDQADKAIDDADIDDKEKQILHDRIELERMVLIYIQLEYFNRDTCEYDELRSINCYPKQKILELCDRFEKDVDKFGIKFVNGDGTPEEVIQNWRNRALNSHRFWEERIYRIRSNFNKK